MEQTLAAAKKGAPVLPLLAAVKEPGKLLLIYAKARGTLLDAISVPTEHKADSKEPQKPALRTLSFCNFLLRNGVTCARQLHRAKIEHTAITPTCMFVDDSWNCSVYLGAVLPGETKEPLADEQTDCEALEALVKQHPDPKSSKLLSSSTERDTEQPCPVVVSPCILVFRFSCCMQELRSAGLDDL